VANDAQRDATRTINEIEAHVIDALNELNAAADIGLVDTVEYRASEAIESFAYDGQPDAVTRKINRALTVIGEKAKARRAALSAPLAQAKGARALTVAAPVRTVGPVSPIDADAPLAPVALANGGVKISQRTTAYWAKRVVTEGAPVLLPHAYDATPTDSVIRLLHTGPNPKSRKAAVRFSLYRDGATIAEHIALYARYGFNKRSCLADLAYDTNKGWVRVYAAQPMALAAVG
jgi:hypothetical protein